MSIRKISIGWLVLFVVLLISGEAYAGPVLKTDVVLEQVNGSKFTARPYGDEWHNGYETKDGYTILFDKQTGNWSYADRAADGSLVATGMIVNKDMPPGSKQLRAIPFKRPANSLLQGNFIGEGPARSGTGNQRVLVLLIQFADRTLMTTEADWSNLVFGTALSSVKDYYREVSYNHLDLIPATESYGTANDGVVVVTLPYNHPNNGGNLGDTNRQIVRDALIAADPYVDFAAFDDDGNGYISSDELHIVVVVAGYEGSYGGTTASCSPNVWAHTWSLYGTVPAPTLDGKTVASSGGEGDYTQQGEWHCSTHDNPGHMATMGTLAHELGHTLWLPDEYDTDGSSEGIGEWGLMGAGGWATCSGGYPGNCPSHPTAWDKWYLSWLTPTQITGTQTVSIPDVTTSPTVFQLRDNPGGVDWSYGVTSGTGEYFLVENRQKTGYNAGLPGSGLLIWHIWEGASSENDVNQNEAGRRLIALMEADGLNHLNLGTNRGDAGDPFPGTSNNTVFDDTTNPSSNLYCSSGIGFCDSSGVSVSGISASGPTMTATMAVGPPPCTYSISPTSQSFSASGGTGSVSLTTQSGCNWTAVSNASWIMITSNSSGAGSGTVNYSAGANTSASLRSGTMTIAGKTFTVSQDPVETALLNGAPQSGSITGTSPHSTWVYYYVDLPSGATNLVLDLYNLSADVDLYVRAGSKPTLFTYDCRSWNYLTTNEQCSFSAPSSGRWWMGISNWSSGTISYTIKATWSGACSTPGTPSNPSPSNRAAGESTSPTLSWTSSNADSYDVYFGTSSSPPYVGNTTSASYSLSGLSTNTTYYWKIIAKNNCGGSATGPVWSFTAGSAPPVPITIATSPSGRQISADGNTYTAPQTFNWTPGSSHTIAVSSPQSGGSGIQYVFSSWSDGGAQTHTVTAPFSSSNYTAYFNTQYLLTTYADPTQGTIAVNPIGQSANCIALPGYNCYWYNSGQSVTLTATAASGYAFTGWTEDYVGSQNPVTISTNGPKNITANFSVGQVRIDFDGDGKTDIAIWTPENGLWTIIRSSDRTTTYTPYGAPNDILVPGDYDGDGKTDIAVWRPSDGFWFITNSFDGSHTFAQLGAPNDIPVPGDYDGDGKTDIAIWTPSNGLWTIIRSSDRTTTYTTYGAPTDIPVPGDYDGDGKTDIAVWRPSNGFWFIRNSSDGSYTFAQLGDLNDIPVPGDYDGDGKTDIAVWTPASGLWTIIRSSDRSTTYTTYGAPSDIPVPGDYDGDGKTDIAVWRPSNGFWFISNSSDGSYTFTQLGDLNDIPVSQ
jgi:M6 family metalloprotease-like protein